MQRTHIVIHHTAGPDRAGLDWAGIWRYHVLTRGWSDIGYHGVVEKVNGTAVLIAGRPWHRMAAAAPQDDMNRRALHFAVVGNYDTDEVDADLVTCLIHRAITPTMQFYDIPAENIISHRDVKGARTRCPGSNLYRILDVIRNRVR